MAEHLDERVLNGLVGFGRVTQILKRDAQGPALVRDDETFEAVTSGIEVAAFDQSANLDGKL
jgi:hypothetical protein